MLSTLPTEATRYVSNVWTLALSASDGAPLTTAMITRAQTFMPIHGHDGRVVPQISELSRPGELEIDRLTFTMRGPWEVRFWVRSDALAEEMVVFHVCVAK